MVLLCLHLSMRALEVFYSQYAYTHTHSLSPSRVSFQLIPSPIPITSSTPHQPSTCTTPNLEALTRLRKTALHKFPPPHPTASPQSPPAEPPVQPSQITPSPPTNVPRSALAHPQITPKIALIGKQSALISPLPPTLHACITRLRAATRLRIVIG